MPLYEYICPKCGDFEVIAKITSESSKKPCPHCGKICKKIFSKTSPPKFVGSGFHSNDYRKNKR